MSSPEFEKSSSRISNRILATALSVAALAGATMQESTESARADIAPAPGCEFELLTDPVMSCEPDQIPEACVTAAEGQIDHFDYSAYRRWRGYEIAKESGVFNAGVGEEPHLKISIQDDGAIVENQRGHAESVLLLSRMMGATGLRMMYYPKYSDDTEMNNNYLAAIEKAETCGYDQIHMTIACNRKKWSVKKFDNYFEQAVRRFEGRIDSVTPCNEPNFPGWLKRMPGKTLPETYRALYDVGYKATKRVDPNIKVSFGDFAGTDYPIRFMEKALAYCPGDKAPKEKAEQENCPVKVDRVSFHPYEFTKRANGPIELGKEISPEAKKIGISSTKTYISAVKRLHSEGKISTPDGQVPQIDLNEYGGMVRSRRQMRVRNEKDSHRARKYVKVLKFLCSDPESADIITGINFYQFDDPPKAWGGTWSTSLVDLSGRLDLSFYATRSAIRNNDKCIKG